MAVKIVGTRKNSVNIIVVIVILLMFMAVFSAAAFWGISQYDRMEKGYKAQLAEYSRQADNARKQLEQSTKTVYIPLEDLKYNTRLDESMFGTMEVISSLPQDMYMGKEDFGKVINTELKAQTPVMKYMLQDGKITDDLRDVEFNTFTLQSNIVKDDFVDVRIRFPNGEDYIVLSKKKVNDIRLSTGTIWTNIDQKELITVSSAIVDAYLREGTKLYVVKYVEPQMQKSAITTYPVNADVRSVILSDPNILEKAISALSAQIRASLDQRMSLIPKEQLSSVSSGVDKENTDLEKNIQDIIQQENLEEQKNTGDDQKNAAEQQSNNTSSTNSNSTNSNNNSSKNSGTKPSANGTAGKAAGNTGSAGNTGKAGNTGNTGNGGSEGSVIDEVFN